MIKTHSDNGEKLIRGYGGETAKVSKTNDLASANVLVPSIEDSTITIYSNFNETLMAFI
ncbi:MAG: hypothetical protein ACI8SE_000444 [Bacteroidia bacterium]|jgi:hypothetical protein